MLGTPSKASNICWKDKIYFKKNQIACHKYWKTMLIKVFLRKRNDLVPLIFINVITYIVIFYFNIYVFVLHKSQ